MPTPPTLFAFMQSLVAELRASGHAGTARTYAATLRSFQRFCQGRDLSLADFRADTARAYEAHLAARGLRRNTTSMYLRVLRAAYNRAVERGALGERASRPRIGGMGECEGCPRIGGASSAGERECCPQMGGTSSTGERVSRPQVISAPANPFRHVYTGVDRTRKRALSLNDLRRLRALDLPQGSTLDFARALFLFSFYTRGMAFIDIAHLRPAHLRDGLLTYSRHKTRQTLYVRWEPCMQAIVEKWNKVAQQKDEDRAGKSKGVRADEGKAENASESHVEGAGKSNAKSSGRSAGGAGRSNAESSGRSNAEGVGRSEKEHSATAAPYLLPIITRADGTERRQYETALRLVNAKLRILATRLGLVGGLSTYAARHTWATVAYARHIPTATISEALGHNSETTTRIYLASLASDDIDRANSLILNSL